MRFARDLMTLSIDSKEAIRHVFSARRPFGPSSAHGFRDFPEVAELVFSTENQLWREYLTHPRMIVGRKGSGKSSILYQTEKSKYYRFVHRVSTSDLIIQCIDAFFKSPTDFKTVSAEAAGKVWTQMLNTSLMTELLAHDENFRFNHIERYFEVSGLMCDRRGKNLFSILRGLPSGEPGSVINLIISAIVQIRGETGLEYQRAVVEMDDYLKLSNSRAVVILDSVEEYPLHDHQFGVALKGLLRAAGAYGGRFRDLRIGIPAELYSDLQETSSNLMKDFENAMVLHWSPMELLRLIAWRYLVYLSAYDRGRLQDFLSVDINERADVHRVISDFLPLKLSNRTNRDEISIAYVLRHTQLLPRQIIKVFNEAFSNSRPNTPQPERTAINCIISSINNLESQFCKEVYGAYRAKYPYASSICEACIPNLPRFFDESALEKVYRERGKIILQEHSHIGDVSFRNFKQCLFEIGAIGKVRSKTEIYADADFEYAIPGRLHSSKDDELCLHPVFSGAYETNANRNSEHFVYPHMRLYEQVSDRPIWI